MTIEETLLNLYKNKRNNIVYYIINNYGLCQSYAEDIFSDVYIKLYNNRSNIRQNDISGLLWRSCKNKSIDVLRHYKIIVLDENPAEDLIYNPPIGQESIDIIKIRRCLKQLSKFEMKLIDMYYYKQMKCEDICKDVHINLSALKVRLYRIRNKLKGLFINDKFK